MFEHFTNALGAFNRVSKSVNHVSKSVEDSGLGARRFLPIKWWQWIFLYPAFGVAVVGGVTDIAKTSIVELSNYSQFVRELSITGGQQKSDCFILGTSKPDHQRHIVEVAGGRAEVMPCDSGGVWVSYVWKNPRVADNHYFEPPSRHADKKTVWAPLINPAVAEDSELRATNVPVQVAQVIVKQSVDDRGRVVIVRRFGDVCVQEIINPSTGAVLSRTNVACP